MSVMTSLNIVDLIEKNPITRLSNNYQNRLLSKIKTKFNTEDQQLFVASFYSYLNFNSKTDFVINLDNVWNWLGFSQKTRAKELLEKYFVIDKDYKSLLRCSPEQKKKDVVVITKKRSCLPLMHLTIICSPCLL